MDKKETPVTSETSGSKTTEASSSNSAAPRMKPKQPPSPQEKSLVKILEPSTDDDDDDDDDELDLEDSDDDGRQVVNTQASISQSRPAPIPAHGHGQGGGGGGGLINKNVASTGPQQIHIDTLVGNMHIGDIINISATTSNSVAPQQPSPGSSRDDRPQLSESEKDHIRGCHLSRRRLEEDDILRVSRRFGAGWRDVGNSLHFTHAQLDQIESDCGASLEGCSERMLYRWMQWKSEKATIRKLTKALYNNAEFDAITAVDP